MSIFSKLFRKDDSEEHNSKSFCYTPSDSFNPSITEEDDDVYETCIKFEKELSNGSLVFLVFDEYCDWEFAYIIVSPNGVPTFIDSKIFIFSVDEREKLKKQALAFYDAMRA